MEDNNNPSSKPSSETVIRPNTGDKTTNNDMSNQPFTDESNADSTLKQDSSDDNSMKSRKKSKIPKIDFRNMNKNTKLAIALTSVLIIVGTVTFILMRNNNGQVANEDNSVAQEESNKKSLGASITLQEGTLQIQDNGEWKDIASEQTIGEGTSLRTVGATSRAVITFDDGSALRLDANSEAELTELTTEKIQIEHVAGYTYNRVLPSESLKYIVNSNDAQYEAMGTAFITISTGDEQAVEVFHSSVLETSTNKNPKEGEKLTVTNKATPSEDGKITKLNIEEVKNNPFVQWNIELDKKDENYKKTLGFLNDVTAPEITLNSKDGDVVLLEPSATEGTIEISGSTESGAKLTVLSKSQSGSIPIDVTVGSDGKFTTPVLTAPIGDSVFEFIAKDKTGNATTKTVRIKFQKKSQPVAGNAISFVLSSNKNVTEEKVELSWTLNGITTPNGVKVVYGKTENPTLGGLGVDSYPVESGTSSTIKFIKFTPGQTYYIKVCAYDKATGTCGQYSNQVTVVTP